MRLYKYLAGVGLALALVACGGGGGDPGTPSSGTGNTPGDTPGSSTNGSMPIEVLSGTGAPTDSISVLEIAQVKVTVKDAKGAAVKGVVVTFSESGPGLLAIAPASKTALTDSAGVAVVEARALTSTSTGATEILASASISGQTINAQKAISISSAPATSTVDPQDLANAINFLDVNPSDKSIVLAGSGGNSRSESATLRFRVVDKNNTPVKGVAVTFSVVPPNDVILNISKATSDSDGVVVTTVSSKTVATAVVVKALVDTKTISTQSDQLLVTTGVVTQDGFDLSASKYNLNYGVTGDSSEIKVAIVDSNGNPVADGVPVVFTTDYGAVGTSSRGGCTTLNGKCSVVYTVQNPRPADGQGATITASTQIGNGTAVSDSLKLIVSSLDLVGLYTINGIEVTDIEANSCAKFSETYYLGTPAGLPAPAGTTVEVKSLTPNFSLSVVSGSPVLDRVVTRTPVTIEFDVSNSALNPVCSDGQSGRSDARAEIKLVAGTIVKVLAPTVSYPRAP